MKSIKGSNTVRTALSSCAGNSVKTLAIAGLVALPTLFQQAVAQSQPAASAQPVAYGASNYQSDAFMRRIYGGIGVGKSWLEPDTSDVPGTDPNKRVSNAGQIMLGIDFNKWFSIEGHAATLGDAGLSSGHTISYQTLGLSGLAYVGKNRHHFNRRGLSLFGRVGYGVLKNEPSDGLNFQQLNGSHLLLGAGVEFATRMGVGIRAEGIAFDTDVRYGQLSLLYRLGKRPERRRQTIVQVPTIEPIQVPAIAPVPAIAIAPVDSDVDGVGNEIDRCPNTQAGVAVDEVGCDLFTGVIEGVNFNSGSADLTPDAQGILSGVVSTLNRFPSVSLTIMAHTDSQGNDLANKDLSKQRARSVAVYLVRNGISAGRLQAYGYGEDRPLDTNETAEGRLRNRRVEFRAAR